MIDSAIFIGQGYGGQVLMALGAQQPTLIAGAVLIDAGPMTDPRGLVRLRNNLRALEGTRSEAGLPEAPMRPGAAYYSRDLADFILPYEAVRAARSPDDAVLEFYQAAYDAAADLARWDRAALDRPPKEWPA